MNLLAIRETLRNTSRLPIIIGLGILFFCLGIGGFFASQWFFAPNQWGTAPKTAPDNSTVTEEKLNSNQIIFPKNKWKPAHIRIASVGEGDLQKTKWVTGKLMVNQDRTVHVFPQVAGRVQKVNVHFGQDVQKGELLAVIASRELAEAKLKLFQSRLEAKIAKVRADRATMVHENTQQLIEALRKKLPLKEVEVMFRGKPMGDYRQQLVTSYAKLYKSKVDYERLKDVKDTVAGRELLRAQAAYEADRATMKATLEQVGFSAHGNALVLTQALEQANAQVAINIAKLRILGIPDDELKEFDPAGQGAAISHYLVKAPFASTVIKKDATLDERVTIDTEMFQLADLSTIWLEADIYQRDLPLLQNLSRSSINFRLPYSHQVFQAEVFYKGDIVDPKTRTVRLLATVDNPNRQLKPGMFVQVELPGWVLKSAVYVPTSAVVEAEGKQFVFVHRGGETFEQRFVRLGETAGDRVQIAGGLRPGEPVAVGGTFALKTELMKDKLLAEAE